MKSFTVVRSKWARRDKMGPDMGPSWLKNKRGNMCCLGFACREIGITNLDASAPSSTCKKKGDPFSEELVNSGLATFNEHEYIIGSPLSGKAMTINDDSTIPSEKKEELLKELFQEHGIEVNFVD